VAAAAAVAVAAATSHERGTSATSKGTDAYDSKVATYVLSSFNFLLSFFLIVVSKTCKL
jgi:hypothetical protein